MDKKILKYKCKKIKLEEKIFNKLIQMKKTSNKQILKSFENIDFISEIIKEILDFKLNFNNNVFILITGIFSIGKTSFIKHFEDLILMSNIKSKFDIKNSQDVQQIKSFIQIENNLNNTINQENGIVIIETKYNCQEEILEILSDKKIFMINLIPKNFQLFKNKLINKIFESINTKPNIVQIEIFELLELLESIKPICDNQQNFNIIKQNLSENLINMKIKKNDDVFDDSYFDFLDEIINLLLNIDLSNHMNTNNKIKNLVKNLYI